jgi:2-amino-4-hydroxy-6-hydroxymethyldihydropteridine diphosphokinase
MISVSCAIALGSNLGNSQAILERSLQALTQIEGIRCQSVSHWYQTVAIGPLQPDYLNGCAILETWLSPEDLLIQLLTIEQQFGRQRQERWGARTLDLDLIFYGDRALNLPQLQIPHPRFSERAFVLVPLAEIAPNWVDPHSQKTIADLLEAVDCSGVRLFQSHP